MCDTLAFGPSPTEDACSGIGFIEFLAHTLRDAAISTFGVGSGSHQASLGFGFTRHFDVLDTIWRIRGGVRLNSRANLAMVSPASQRCKIA